jgi:preprotein translocase subunit SecA
MGTETMRHIERSIMLQTLDLHWKNHLAAMDQLREGIHLRGYAQQNPKQEYKRESFLMFKQMLEDIKRDVVRTIYSVQIKTEEEARAVEEERQRVAEKEQNKMNFIHASANTMPEGPEAENKESAASNDPYVREAPKIGRNDPCHCGSGKKFKQCHGRLK